MQARACNTRRAGGCPPLLNRLREKLGTPALLQFLLMGVNMSFLTGDLFNLFVSFEVMLIASYGLSADRRDVAATPRRL